ncbi:MAG: hypothetical protein L0Y74_02150 [candidate division Zixibacteria bacterium]|nr:hypothetical protein [candidate division Zixibacteria bacterium]
MEEKKVALKLIIEGKEKEVTFDELTLANNISQEALVRLMIKKNLVTSEELLQELQNVRQERYSQSESNSESERHSGQSGSQSR